MTTKLTESEGSAREAVEGGAAGAFLERLAERIGGQARVQAVFGEPIERGDLTVVPVARVRWGLGGGAGSATDGAGGRGSGSGSGGGGGAAADPVGYLEIGARGATFQRIPEQYPSPALTTSCRSAASLAPDRPAAPRMPSTYGGRSSATGTRRRRSTSGARTSRYLVKALRWRLVSLQTGRASPGKMDP